MVIRPQTADSGKRGRRSHKRLRLRRPHPELALLSRRVHFDQDPDLTVSCLTASRLISSASRRESTLWIICSLSHQVLHLVPLQMSDHMPPDIGRAACGILSISS